MMLYTVSTNASAWPYLTVVRCELLQGKIENRNENCREMKTGNIKESRSTDYIKHYVHVRWSDNDRY